MNDSLVCFAWGQAKAKCGGVDNGEFCIYFSLSYLVFCYDLSLFCGYLCWFYFVGEFQVKKSKRKRKKRLKQASGRIGPKNEWLGLQV